MSKEHDTSHEKEQRLGKLVVLTSTTASGKTEIKKALESQGIGRVVTATTRPPRDGEVDGIDYHFITEEEYIRIRDAKEFAEFTDYGNWWYGTPKKELEPLFHGINLVTSMDIKGAAQFKDKIFKSYEQEIAQLLLPNIAVVVVGLPSLMTAKTRFYDRERQSGGVIDSKIRNRVRSRLTDDWHEWNEFKDEFDTIIFNRDGQLDAAVEQITSLFGSNA